MDTAISISRHFFSSWSFIMMLGQLNLISIFSVNRHAPEDNTGFIFIFCYCLWSMLHYVPIRSTCPPLWCCSLCRYSSGCRRRPYCVSICTRTLLIQGSHLLCDRWFLRSGQLCTLGSSIIMTVRNFWMPEVRYHVSYASITIKKEVPNVLKTAYKTLKIF